MKMSNELMTAQNDLDILLKERESEKDMREEMKRMRCGWEEREEKKRRRREYVAVM
jgi:hypothetical protein